LKGVFVLDFKGKWRITEMELWDQEAIDLDCKAYISIEGDQLGGTATTLFGLNAPTGA
jgi:hypothetical protein